MKRLEHIPTKYRRMVEAKLRQIQIEIQRKREEKGFTQESFAEALDISSETVRAVEQGRRAPSLPMLLYICAYLGIEIKISS